MARRELPEGELEMLDGHAQNDLDAAQEFAAEARLMTPIVDVVCPTMTRTLVGEFHDLLPEDSWERGIAVAAKVYGEQIASGMNGAPRSPVVDGHR